MKHRSRLGRVRGLGSAKSGTEHWMMQRLTAIALVPLCIWFVGSIMAVVGTPEYMVRGWLQQPMHAILMALMITFLLHHGQLGLQVVIEDYIHQDSAKIVAIVVLKLVTFCMGVIGLFAVVKLAVLG